MKLKTLLLVLLTSFSISISAASAYQQKVYKIYEKYYTLFKDGYSHGLNMTESIMFSVDPEAMTAMAAMNALEYMPLDMWNEYKNGLEKELKQAESLMTPEERKKNVYPKTALEFLEQSIQTKLKQWAVKGDFEKTTDYQNRLQKEGNAQFVLACSKSFPIPSFFVKPTKYDADKEKYDLEIEYMLQFKGKGYTQKISASLPINIETAQLISSSKEQILISDCVWGIYENNITPLSYKMSLNGKTYDLSTKAHELVINGSKVMPDIVEFKSLSYNYTQHQIDEITNKKMMLQELTILNKNAEEQKNILNTKIKASPYYNRLPEDKRNDFLVSFEPKYYTQTDDINVIEDYYNKLNSSNGIFPAEEDLINYVKQYLKQNDKKEYVEAFFTEYPDSALIIKQEWQEYKCNYNYQIFDDFVIAYQERKLDTSLRNCKEKAWKMYGKYYDNREEFDNDYEEGEIALKKRKDLYDLLERKVRDIHGYLNLGDNKKISSMNLQGAKNSKDQNVIGMVQLYNSLSTYPVYQEKAANIILEENEKAKKEYEKYGSLFTSKSEFITMYFEADYKQILKSRK